MPARFPGRTSKREGSLLVLVYDTPGFGACGVFPPLHLLNQLLSGGGSQGGMSPGATWEPFSLSEQEYRDLVAAVRAVAPKVCGAERGTRTFRIRSIRPSISIRTTRRGSSRCAPGTGGGRGGSRTSDGGFVAGSGDENGAGVRATMSGWVDYMHMARWNRRWVIMNVLGAQAPEPVSPPHQVAIQ